MPEDLSQLKNLGSTTIQWLHLIGINSGTELSTIGAPEAYSRIKQRGLKASKVTLYALHGALHNQPWHDIDPAMKDLLVAEAQALGEPS